MLNQITQMFTQAPPVSYGVDAGLIIQWHQDLIRGERFVSPRNEFIDTLIRYYKRRTISKEQAQELESVLNFRRHSVSVIVLFAQYMAKHSIVKIPDNAYLATNQSDTSLKNMLLLVNYIPDLRKYSNYTATNCEFSTTFIEPVNWLGHILGMQTPGWEVLTAALDCGFTVHPGSCLRSQNFERYGDTSPKLQRTRGLKNIPINAKELSEFRIQDPLCIVA